MGVGYIAASLTQLIRLEINNIQIEIETVQAIVDNLVNLETLKAMVYEL